MAADSGDGAASLHERIAAFLADSEAPHDLTEPLSQLAEDPAPAAKLALTGALHQILATTFSLDDAARPQSAQLAAFLRTTLFVPIDQADAGDAVKLERKAAVADAVIDVAWQLDQQVELLVPLAWNRQSPPPPAGNAEASAPQHASAEAKMEVDPTPASAEPDRQVQIAGAVSNARQRLGHVLRALIDSGDMPQGPVFERLDATLIGALGPPANGTILQRSEVRARTTRYYRQQKFNLLREESEGYSKLLVEVLASLGPAHSTLTASPQETEAERARRAKSVNDKMKTLIGNFDLDPSRTLDVLLDAFSDNAVEHWQIFIDILAASPWAPNRRPGVEREVNGTEEKKGKQPAVDVGLEREEGSDIIAQILGFKFAYYQRASAPEVPQGLYTTAALLIWHGLVKLTDLWPHLSPSDDDLVKLDTQWRDEQAQRARSVGGANALAMAGALVDDEAPASGSTSSSAQANAAKASTSAAAAAAAAPAPNQKVGLLCSMLSIGDITHSFFLLGQYPFLVSAFPDVADLLNRLLSVSMAPAYASTSIATTQAAHSADFTATRSRVTVDSKGEKKVTPLARTFALTADAFPNPRHDWTFFFPRWQERLPRAGDAAEVVMLLEEVYLPLVKTHVARKPTLLAQLLRIAAEDLGANAADHPRRTNWLDLLRSYLVPAISLLEHYPTAALDLWAVLSLFPIETRFQIYGEWKDVHYRRDPALAIRKAEAERDIKSLLRRLSTENVKKLGKTFARIAHTNPAVIFGIALHQVQSYDNLIIPVVEACRYLTDLGYDVMAYSILDALSSSRPKTKEDGTSIAMWLQGLATFTGSVYRRWVSMQPSLWVILQYLVNQLVSGNSKDLVVLRELISRMTAIEPFADLSDAQVASLAGGKYLRSEVFQKTDIGQMSMRGQQEGLAKAKLRLAASLLGKDLAVPLLVNIALQRQACLKTDAHLKSLGALFDQNHAILFQYTELLLAIAEPDQLAELVPPVEDLLDRFKLDAGIAFDIARPRLRAALREFDQKEAAEVASSRKKQGLLAKLAREKERNAEAPAVDAAAAAARNGKDGDADDVKMEDVKPEGESGSPPSTQAQEGKNVGEIEEAEAIAASAETVVAVSPAPASDPWHPGLASAISRVEALLPSEARSTIGAGFFVTFWQLTLHDIVYPKERYDAEIGRLKLLQREASVMPVAKADDRRVFIDSVMSIASGLVEEAAKHLTARSTINRRLNREKAHWFAGAKTKADRLRLVEDLLQYCIQPRARMSLPDATFAYQIVKRLHSMNTPNFHAILFFNRLLSSQISPILYSCTENEARNYGLFLHDALADLCRWYKDAALYDTDVIGAQLEGFKRTLGKSSDEARTHYDHAEFQAALLKWQEAMTQGFVESFASAEYMHIKNSILVLTKIAPYFPLDHKHGSELQGSVTALLAIEQREDLKILAQGYKAVLFKRKKDWVNRPAPTPAASSRPSPAPVSAPAKPASDQKPASPAVTPAPAPPAKTAEQTSVPSASSTIQSPAVPRGNLPPKPGSRAAEEETKTNMPNRPTAERSASSSGPAPREGLSLAERLKKEALASKRTLPPTPTAESKMEPPRAPAGPRGSAPRALPGDAASRSSGPSRPSSPREGDSDRERRDRDERAARDDRDSRDLRDVRASTRDTRADSRSLRDSREPRDVRDTRDVGNRRSARDSRDGQATPTNDDRHDIRDSKDARKSREGDREREQSVESSHSSRASRSDTRELRESRDGRDGRDNRSSRDSRSLRDDRRDLRRDDRREDKRDDRRDDKRGGRREEKPGDKRDEKGDDRREIRSPDKRDEAREEKRPDRRDDKRDDRRATRPDRRDSPDRSRDARDSRSDRRSTRDDTKEEVTTADRERPADSKNARPSREVKEGRRDDDRRDRRTNERSERETREDSSSASRREAGKREESSEPSRRARDPDRFAATPTPATEEESRHARRERRHSDRKLTREEEAREAEKEKQRERDRQREAERDAARKAQRERRFQAPPTESSSSRNGLPHKPAGGSGDRLRPAPARAHLDERSPAASPSDSSAPSLLDRARANPSSAPASPKAAVAAPEASASGREEPAAMEGLSIKGRGRLFQGLTSGSMGSSGDRRDEESSRKRLADRLGPEDPKRPRTDEAGSRERRSRR